MKTTTRTKINHVTFIMLCFMTLLTILVSYLYVTVVGEQHQHDYDVHYDTANTHDCYTIEVKKGIHDDYIVVWTDNFGDGGTYMEHVEVEYPDEDYTHEEQLAYELRWTLSEMEELCFTYHNHDTEGGH
jgi:hypothetical protein